MTKRELLDILRPFTDEIEIVFWEQQWGSAEPIDDACVVMVDGESFIVLGKVPSKMDGVSYQSRNLL